MSVKIIIFNLIYGLRGFNINLRFIKKVFQNIQIFGDVKNFGKSILSTLFTFFDGFFELLQSITGSFQSTLFTETIFILSVSWFFWWNCTLENKFGMKRILWELSKRLRLGDVPVTYLKTYLFCVIQKSCKKIVRHFINHVC